MPWCPSLTPGVYNLITGEYGLDGVAGNQMFDFSNATTSKTVNVGGTTYALTLNSSAAALTVTVAEVALMAGPLTNASELMRKCCPPTRSTAATSAA